ncbi:MAG TPA: hypothetical protein VGO67_03110 [Verrucomicrobiae bacterium]|jgi:hypothetical protein
MSIKTSKRSNGIISEFLNQRTEGLPAVAMPVWIRPPKRGNEFYSGLSRPKLYQLAADGKITTRTLREPGQIKGTRLFLLSSIFQFIEGCGTGN